MGKSLHPIRNWSEYNRGLVERGNLTVWMDASAIASWHNVEHHGGRGRGYRYSDTAIETVLMLKAVFKLPLRGKVSQSLVDVMSQEGCLGDLPEDEQIDLFAM